MRTRSGIVAISLAMLLTLVVTSGGCSTRRITFVDEGATYGKDTAPMLLDTLDISALSSKSTSDSVTLRHDALTDLRAQGDSAAGVADMLTKTFSADMRGVPVYVERASFEGKPAVILVEATGPRGSTLATKRLWVLDEQGGVLFVASR